MWFPLFRNVTRLLRLADRMVGGPILRTIKRLTVWAHAMVGGPLCPNVTPGAGLALLVVGDGATVV